MAFWSEWVLEMLKCFSYFQLFTKERGRQLASITITIPLCVTTKLSHSFARQMEPAYNMGIELFPFLPPPPARSVGKQINGWGCQGLHVPQLIPPSPTTPNSSVRPHRCLRNTLPLADSVTAGPPAMQPVVPADWVDQAWCVHAWSDGGPRRGGFLFCCCCCFPSRRSDARPSRADLAPSARPPPIRLSSVNTISSGWINKMWSRHRPRAAKILIHDATWVSAAALVTSRDRVKGGGRRGGGGKLMFTPYASSRLTLALCWGSRLCVHCTSCPYNSMSRVVFAGERTQKVRHHGGTPFQIMSSVFFWDSYINWL